MPKFALIVGGEISHISTLPERPDDIPHKGVVWLPYVEEDVSEAVTAHTHVTQLAPVIETDRVVKRNVTVDVSADERRARMVVSPYQARIALLNAGMLETVEALMEHPDTPMQARLAWTWAVEIRRISPFIEALGPLLALTPEQLDGLFEAAEQVV